MKKRIAFLLPLALALHPFATLAQDRTWTGTTGSWDVPGNWSGSAVPTTAGDAFISSGTATLGVGVSGEANDIYLGRTGNGSLSISGGYLSSREGTIGGASTRIGVVTVSSGTWRISEDLSIGYLGSGTLNLSGGLVNSGGYAALALRGGSTGTAIVSGGTWSSSYLYVGYEGNGTLTVSGGLVSAQSVEFGDQGGSGTATLSGGVLRTGYVEEGSGSGLLIFNGGTLQATGNQGDFLRNFEAGDVTINSGGAFIDSGAFSIGIGTALSGTGGLTKLGAGTLTLTGSNSYAGGTTVRSGTLVLNGGSVAHGATNAVVGMQGGDNAALVLQSGASMSSDRLILAQLGGVGAVTVSGTGTEYRVGNVVSIGYEGAGTLNILNGGTVVSDAYVDIGVMEGGGGVVNVDGAGSIFSSALSFNVGFFGSGTLNVTNGGSVSARDFAISPLSTGAGVANVDGIGSVVTSTNAVYFSGVSAVLNVRNGGTFIAPVFTNASDAGKINLDGGTLRFAQSVSEIFASFSLGEVEFQSGGAIFDTQAFSVATSLGLQGAGSLTKIGTGTLSLSGSNGYTGATNIDEGTLAVSGSGSLAGSSSVNIGSAAVFTIEGSSLTSLTIKDLNGAGQVLLGSKNLTLGTANSGTYAGTISGTGGSLTKQGTGTLTLSGSNSFSGGVTVLDGIVSVFSATNLGAGSVTLSGGALQSRGTFSTGKIFNLSTGGGTLLVRTGETLGLTGQMNQLSGAQSLTIGDAANAGQVNFSGTANHTGTTTVASGTLSVNGSFSGTSAVSVANGAALAGSGTIAGSVTVQNGGKLATGNSIGTLTVGSASFESGSFFSLEGDGTFFDSLVVGGNVTLQSGALISFGLLSPLTAESYTLITAAGGLDGSVQFTLSGAIPSGYRLEYAGTALNLVLAPATIGPVTATPNDTAIITGGTTGVVVTVGNSGTNSGGADLNGTVTGDGTNVSGTSTVTVAQGTTGTASPDLAFSSTTIGVQTGTVTVIDPDATNSPQTGTVTVNVLDHADPVLTVSGGNSQSVIVGATGVTATLNLANGTTGEANLSPMDVGSLSTGLSGTTGSGVIASGAIADYTAALDTGTVGAGQEQVFSLDAGDQQTLSGANPLATYSATVALNVYGHADPVLSGTTLSLGYVHVGYASPVVSSTQLVANGTAGAYMVDLKADAVASGNLTVNGVRGVASGSSANIAATLATGQGVGVISGTLAYTFADDSSLAGASSNVGTTTFLVTGEVYSGQGVWNKVGGGSWGTLASGFGENWQAGGGSPGLDAAFASTDTATFGTAGSGVVTLDGASPSLKAVTFDNASASYEIAQGTGGVLTMNGGTTAAVIENLSGNHAITAPLALATDTLFTVANAANRLTIGGTISGPGDVEIGGAGRTVFTQSQSYAGTTTVTSGVLASRNLTGGAVNLEGGLFSSGNNGTVSQVTVSTLNLNGGGLEFDLGAPGASDSILVTGTATLNGATQFTFLDAGFGEGVFALVQGGTLANFSDLGGLTFVSDIDGLQGIFGVAGNTLYFRGFTADTIFTGPVLSNYAPYLILPTGKFLVDGPVTTWSEDLSNTIGSLIFKNGSNLTVFNDLTVTSGDFTVRRGSASIVGGRVIVPGDFNLIGAGTLYAGSEFAIGGDANVNGGNLVIDGAFDAGGNMNVHSTVTVNGNAQIAGNLNTDDSEIVVNGIFGIGRSANINNGSSLLVNLGGVMNVTEATNIHAGSSAQVNGLLTSPQVNVSGLLKGTGVIAGNVWNNGVVAPGNSPGVLTVNGNYTQTTSGALEIELGDLLLVSGHAAIAGTLELVAGGKLELVAGGKLEYGQQITFLQAGSISGEFDNIVMPNSSKYRGRFLVEGGTGTLLVAPTSYTLVAENANQRKVARALDSYIPERDNDRETVSIALDLQAAEQYPAAFDQIAPTYYETLGDITIEQAFVQSQQINQRLSAVRLGARGFQAIGIESPLVHDKDGKSVFEAKDAKKNVEVETPTNWSIWAMGNGLFTRVTSVGQVPDYSFNSGGFLVGGDYTFGRDGSPSDPSLALGLYGGYQYTWADAGDSSNTQINSALFGGYATYSQGGFYADAVVGGGYNGYRVRRGINFSTIDRTARSQPNGGQFNASLNLGYDWEVGKFTFGPIAGVQYAYAGIAPFSETGADSLDLRVAQQNVNSMRTTFGGRVAYTWNVTDRIALIPEVRMFWQHEFLNNPRNINSALDGGSGPTFGYETSAPARDSVFAGAGVSAQFGERWNAFLYWNVDFGRQDYFGNSVSGGLNWKF
jgi:fibronectin-binding autotransporter adhesin